jgi:hypothetical protein
VQLLVALVLLALVAVLPVLILRRAGIARREAMLAGAAAAVAVVLLTVAAGFLSLGECLNDNAPPSASWYWSPREEFCDRGYPDLLSILIVFVIPAGLATAGALLVSHQRRWLAVLPFAALFALPALPFLYLDSLDEYRYDSYPVLDQPLLRPARGGMPARVCYVYGIVTGPRKVIVTPQTMHHCIELARTPEATRLRLGYDGGRTVTDLTRAGQNLTQEGLPVRAGPTGVHGLIVRRASLLSDRAARQGARFPDGYLEGLSKPFLPRRAAAKPRR